MFIRLSLILSALCFSSVALATPSAALLQPQVAKVLPNAHIDAIADTPIAGVYQVISGNSVLYLTENGQFAFYGHLLDLKQDQPVSLTEEASKSLRLKAISQLDPQSFLTFGPEHAAHTLTVFTDIDCTYCRKLHQEVPALNKAGIAVRYVAFPRAGVGSSSFDKAVAVWCSANRQQAMTDAKAGKAVAKAPVCNQAKVIKRHLQLVRELELNATPIIMLEDGTQIPGYLPADKLIEKVIPTHKVS